MTVRHRLVGGIVVAVLAGCGGGHTEVPSVSGPPSASAAEGGALEVDTGFRPDRNGFSFPNRIPDEPFAYADAVAMFGPDAICRQGSGECTPRPEAQAWVEKLAAASWGGLCEGMAVMAADRWADHEQPDTAGLPESAPLAHRLMQWWATQFLTSVMEASTVRSSDPRELLDRLDQAIGAGGPGATLTLDHRGASHSLTPYAIGRDGSTASILVYDPGRPGEEGRVELDLDADTWTYDFPGDPAGSLPWTGRAFDVGVIALDARAVPWPAPFLGSPTGAAVATVTTSGSWTVLRTTADGAEVALRADQVEAGRDGVVAFARGGALGTVTLVVDVGAGLRVETDSPTHVTVESAEGAVSARTGDLSAPGSSAPATVVVDASDGPRLAAEEGGVELAAFTGSGVVRALPGDTRALRITVDGAAAVTGADGVESVVVAPDEQRTDAVIAPGGEIAWSEPASLPESVREGTPEPDWSTPGGGTSPAGSSTSTSSPGSPGTGGVGPTDGSDRVTISIEFVAPGSVHVAIASLPDNDIAFVPSLSGPGIELTGESTLSIDRTATDLQQGAEYTLTLAFDDGFVVHRSFVLP